MTSVTKEAINTTVKVNRLYSADIYKKIMSAPIDKKNDIYRYEMMMPFKGKWDCYHIPIKAEREGAYDIIMAWLIPGKETIVRLLAALAHETNHNVRYQFIKWTQNVNLGEMLVSESSWP